MVLSRILTDCLVVFSVGAILTIPLAAQTAEEVTWSQLHIAQLKATPNYTFVLFQPQSIIKKANEGDAKLTVEIFEGNDTNGKAIDTQDLPGPYLGLDSTKFKRFKEYLIHVIHVSDIATPKKTTTVLNATFTSSPGEPSKVIKPEWEMHTDGDSSKADLHWSPPAAPEGPIDGYEVKHCSRDIINRGQRNDSDSEETERVCEEMETSVALIEIEVLRGKRYDTHIRAFNEIEPEFGAQGKQRLVGKWETVTPANDKIPSVGGNNATVAVLIVISVLLSLVIVGYAGYKYYRKNYN